MNSLFLKHFLIYSLVIVVSFVILGGAYVAQVNRYAVEDKENTLEQTASRAGRHLCRNGAARRAHGR